MGNWEVSVSVTAVSCQCWAWQRLHHTSNFERYSYQEDAFGERHTWRESRSARDQQVQKARATLSQPLAGGLCPSASLQSPVVVSWLAHETLWVDGGFGCICKKHLGVKLASGSVDHVEWIAPPQCGWASAIREPEWNRKQRRRNLGLCPSYLIAGARHLFILCLRLGFLPSAVSDLRCSVLCPVISLASCFSVEPHVNLGNSKTVRWL